ncbi:MAG: helicase-related protein [Bacteroidota bacterium]
MLLDNENQHPKVHEWIAKHTKTGKLDIVTGYFTIGALAWLSRQTNEKIEEYKFVLGDIVNYDEKKDRSLDLLNEQITTEAAFHLTTLAKEAVAFLKQDKVLAKTLEPNFCHAKAYLYSCNDGVPSCYYISGSSNLTEAGLGLRTTSNIELNTLGQGTSPDYNELSKWFENLWVKPQAHFEKTIVTEKGVARKVPFKQYLIDEIERIFIEYTPRQLYFKVLFELFGKELSAEETNPELNRQIGRLENTVIYQSLYEFQQKGVLSLIRMLQRHNGAVLADAVGLGKTWTALAVMKFFEMQGREIIVLCPKKLRRNWEQYQRKQNSKFEKDNIEYIVRFHTDMTEGRLDRYDLRYAYVVNKKPKLIVIDESHNLRNDKSARYNYLLEKILRKNEDVKILMLSATPINNSLMDVRNQFKLIVKGNIRGFDELLGVKNIDSVFRKGTEVFRRWAESGDRSVSNFIREIPQQFFDLTNNLLVARTRKLVKEQQDGLYFPRKAKPENLWITPNYIGNYESFDELFNHFPKMLSGYQPTRYITQAEKVEKTEDQQQRERFLVKMMYILMVKRLESCWASFHSTVERILFHHQNALERIKDYEKQRKDLEAIDSNQQMSLFEDDEWEDEMEEITLGKKIKIKISDIDLAGNLQDYKDDLKTDIEALQALDTNLDAFRKTIGKEIKKRKNIQSADSKLEALIKIIKKKQQSGNNSNNQKVLIFTVYKDTAAYLYEQLIARGFPDVGMVAGDEARTSDKEVATQNFEPILERFSPYTKLFRERNWEDFKPSAKSLPEQYEEWLTWVEVAHPPVYEQVQTPIDILIATDVLSEGQNLQDCDLVINYDIHWNPVRVIQRMGRIDRLGSPNERIYGVNFWPSDNINTYLALQSRIEQRMAAMKLAGAEVDSDFTDTLRHMVGNDELEQQQRQRMMEQMQTTWDDIEVSDQTLGFDNLSLENFRQDLATELGKKHEEYERMPNGIYTGFMGKTGVCEKEGIIVLLGSPSKPAYAKEHVYKQYELLYLDSDGKQVLLNQKEVLDALAAHKEEERMVPAPIDRGDADAIESLQRSLQNWIRRQEVIEEVQENGEVKERMGQAGLDLLNKLKAGQKSAVETIVKEKALGNNNTSYDLITWFVVSK